MDLEKFFNKNIRITFLNGKIIEGYVEVYTPAFDNSPEEIEEISIKRKGYNGLVGITEQEIEDEVKKIELI